LVDGEHYPPVIARAIEDLRSQGEDPVAALLVGGGEKLRGDIGDIGVELFDVRADPEAGLVAGLKGHEVDVVLDISGDPVMHNTARGRMASIATWMGKTYRGPDFQFDPPVRPKVATAPSVAIIGSGKRSGKTAISAAAARVFAGAELKPVIVAMGRGGPADPEVISDPSAIDVEVLREWSSSGRHAASDYIEGAISAGVPTVGAWRAGEGMAGAVAASNVSQAVEVAASLDPGLLILEGSGAAIPPVASDGCIFVIDVRTPIEYLRGYLGLYKLLLADLVVITMMDEPTDQASDRASLIEDCLRSGPRDTPRSVRVVLKPQLLGNASPKRVYVATTASEEANRQIVEHLEKDHQIQVAGSTTALADRDRLERDLQGLADVDAVVVEIKAAAIDVVAEFCEKQGIAVVFMDNRPVPMRKTDDLNALFLSVATAARERFDG
jgi:cyclic 2,3-diphosphoglycerate synthetase